MLAAARAIGGQVAAAVSTVSPRRKVQVAVKQVVEAPRRYRVELTAAPPMIEAPRFSLRTLGLSDDAAGGSRLDAPAELPVPPLRHRRDVAPLPVR
jgi:hypothetical protein